MPDTVNGWTDHGVFVGGSSMGDGQIGDDIQRRYTKPHPTVPGQVLVVDETYAVVHACTQYHGADYDALCGVDAEWYAENEIIPAPYVWDNRTEFRIEDVDGNEVQLVEISYGSGSYVSFVGVEAAHADALWHAQDHRGYIDWNGEGA